MEEQRSGPGEEGAESSKAESSKAESSKAESSKAESSGAESSGASQKPASGAPNWRASFREAGPYLGLGFQIGGTVALFLGAGYLLDRWLGTLPWLTVAGGVVGMVAALLYIARVSNELGDGSGPPSSSP